MSIVSSSVKIYSNAACTDQYLVATVAGTTSLTQSIAVTGLNPSTNYWAKAFATDNNGLVGESLPQSFATIAATYIFVGTVGYTNSYDTLDCDVQVSCAGATFTDCGIQFSTTSDFSGQIISGHDTTSSFVDEVTGFAEHTTYYYRYYATSTEYGGPFYYTPSNNTITTMYDEPSLTITSSNVTDTTATVSFLYTGNMPVDPTAMSGVIAIQGGGGTQITVDFEHLVAGTAMPVSLSGLTPNTTYAVTWDVEYYSTEVSQVTTFTTLPAAPTVSITSVTNITPSGATVNLTIS